MDAAPESSVISSFLDSDRFSRRAAISSGSDSRDRKVEVRIKIENWDVGHGYEGAK